VVIVPDFKETGRRYRISEEIGKRFQPTVGKGKEEEQVYVQVLNFEKKEEANPNNKCI
jgi:hypothetical protein